MSTSASSTTSNSSSSTDGGTKNLEMNGTNGPMYDETSTTQNGSENDVNSHYPTGNYQNMTQNTPDPTGPLPNEIFELLNEFWRPNELVAPDAHLMNGKVSRRSPEGSLDDTVEEEKETEDDLTSLGDTDMGVDRNTQKRRYSRLSDGYERLKSVLPSVKDKRRVSKARILDEAINYIQRLESITNVLKREHEKRLSMLNGSGGFFQDYSTQPYLRSLFQKQMYPQCISTSKLSQYPKISSSTTSLSKSPRLKQYSSYQTSNSISTDYNYNNLNNFASNPLYQTSNQLDSPIANNSPYSACSMSPGTTPTSFQNGAGSTVNNSWPYQSSMEGYDTSNPQLSDYASTRQQAYGNSAYLNNTNMWGNIAGMSDGSTQVVPHVDHTMKVV